jgi:hypothetical protein
MLDAPSTIDDKQFEELQIKLDLKDKNKEAACKRLLLFDYYLK